MAERDRDEALPAGEHTQNAWRPPAATVERARIEVLPTMQSGAAPQAAPLVAADGQLHLAVGSTIGGRYVIEKHISSGGFGAVYRASDKEIRHHHVAVKLLHRPSASEAERESALRELMLIASVSHPSVVQFKDYGWHEGRLWFAMPWYKGQTLDRVLEGGAMSRAEARTIFSQVSQALAAMHAVGVHHHDIKPENIFLAEIAGFPAGLPVLLDLGIATQRGENPQGLTVEYASPETAAAMLGEAKSIGSAADVFSLALVLRNALDPSVASPVHPDNVIPALHQRATELVPLPKARELTFLSPNFRSWLSLDPAERPTAAEFAEQLHVLTAPEELRRARMRLAKRIVPVLLVAGLLITGLVFQLRKQKTVLSEREKQLSEERQAGEELRKQSEAQLDEIEKQAQNLGNEKAKLDQTLALARKLNEQLSSSTKRAATLDRRVAALTSERNTLASEKQSLTTARDALQQTEQRLMSERDNLRTNLGRVTSERDQLTQRAARVQADLDRVRAQSQELSQRIAGLEKDEERLQRELTSEKARYEQAARRRDEAIAAAGEQADKVKKLEAENRKLEKRVAELEAKQKADAPKTEPPKIKVPRIRPKLPPP